MTVGNGPGYRPFQSGDKPAYRTQCTDIGGAQVLCGKYLGKRMVKRTRSVFSLDKIIMMILSALLLIVLEVTLSTYRQESVFRIPNPHLQPELQE